MNLLLRPIDHIAFRRPRTDYPPSLENLEDEEIIVLLTAVADR